MGQSNSNQTNGTKIDRSDSEDTVWSEVSESVNEEPDAKQGVEKYSSLSVLGEGNQGQVMKVRNLNTGKFFAMKVIPNASSSRKHRLSLTPGRNLQAEISILRRIEHQNIVKLVEVVDSPTDNTLRLIMEYVPGGCIQQLSDNLLLTGRGIPLEEETARSYFRQLLGAIDYLFCHGIVHRDIKPSNLLINAETGELKLGDFGIAIPTRTDKAAKLLGNDDDIYAGGFGVVGTPAFLPPEYYKIVYGEPDEFTDTESEIEVDEFDNEIVSDRKASKILAASQPLSYHGRDADIWALGMTLFAFMYGSLPFIVNFGSFTSRAVSQGDTEIDVISDRILTMPLRFPGTGLGTSPKLRHLIGRMLEKDPARRAGLREIFSDPWICKYKPMPPLTATQKKPIFEQKHQRNSDLIPIVTNIQKVGRKLRSQAHILHHRARASMNRNHTSSTETDPLGIGHCA